jgi:hypothetical protein
MMRLNHRAAKDSRSITFKAYATFIEAASLLLAQIERLNACAPGILPISHAHPRFARPECKKPRSALRGLVFIAG